MRTIKSVASSIGLASLLSSHSHAYPVLEAQSLNPPSVIADAVIPEQIQRDLAGASRQLLGDRSSTPITRGESKSELFTVDQAVLSAVESHPTVQQAIGLLSQSGENIDVARAGYFPQIRGGLTTEYDDRLDRYNDRVVHKMTVSATQMLYDFGKVSSAVDRAEAGRAASRARVLLSIDQVARETAYAFVELQRYHALAGIAAEQVEGVSAIAALARERHSKGASTLSDELQAQSREEAARATLTEMLSQVGRWQQNVLYLTGLDNIGDLETGVPSAFAQACDRREPVWGLLPEMLVAEAERAEALASLDEAGAQSYPTLSLEGTLGRALNTTTISGHRNDASAMLNFSMPLYQGGAIQAQTRAAGYALRAADAAIHHARLGASQNLVEARNRARGYRQRMGLLAQRTKSIALTRDLYKQQYLELGTRSLLDLLNAEQEYHQAKIENTNNMHDMRRMQLDCLYNSGRMREAFDLDGMTIAGVELQP